MTICVWKMYLDNPIPDHSNTEKSTMSTIDAKMKRCCISTEYGNIWVQGKTIPQMCQAFHEKMRMLEGASSDSQEEGANPLFEDYAQEWWDTYEAKRLSGGTKIDYDMNLHKHVIPYFKGKRLKDITTKDVQGFYDERAEYANSTCRHWRTLLYGIFKNTPYNCAQTIHVIPADQNFEKKRSSSALFAREINLVTQPSFDCEQGINSQVQTACSNADAIFPVLGIVSCRNERFSLSRKTHVSGDLTTSIVLSYSTFLSIDDIFKIIFYILTLNFSLPQKEHWRVASTQWPF